MDIYHYSRVTGELLGKGKADPDPLDKGNWLVPANATKVEPPNPVSGLVTRFDGGKWVQDEGAIIHKPPGEEPRAVNPVAKLVEFLRANPDVLALIDAGKQANGRAK